MDFLKDNLLINYLLLKHTNFNMFDPVSAAIIGGIVGGVSSSLINNFIIYYKKI